MRKVNVDVKIQIIELDVKETLSQEDMEDYSFTSPIDGADIYDEEISSVSGDIITVSLTIGMDEEIEVAEVIQNMDYFIRGVSDSKILDWNVKDSK